MARTTQRRPAPQRVPIAGLAADRYAAVDAVVGPPIVYVHGAMDRAAGFRRTAVQLPHRAVLAYDRRGYAGSIGASVSDDFAVHVDDLLGVCAELDEPPLVVAHSMGGLIALHALARDDAAERFAGAVVWESPLAWNDWYRSRGDDLIELPPADAAEQFMRRVIGGRLWDRLPSQMQAERREEGPALLADLVASRSPSAAVPFERITLPVVAGYGTGSDAHHQRSMREVAAAVPSARLVAVDGAEHGIHLSSPAAFAALIESWRS